LKVLPKSVLL